MKTTGNMPTAPGQWQNFLAIYAGLLVCTPHERPRASFLSAGLWVTSHFMRPIRLSLACAAAPFFEKVNGSRPDKGFAA